MKTEQHSRQSSRVALSGAAWCGLLLVVVVFAVWLAYFSFVINRHRYFVLADDAMISMRYAYFLAHGQGFVWNPGQRVEGFTNLGWTLVMAAAHLLPLPLRLMSLLLQLTNLVLHLMLMVWVYRFMRLRAGERPALATMLLVGLNAPLLAYGLMGFETSLQSLLITAALLRFVPGPVADAQNAEPLPTAGLRWTPLLCALAFVVRPDAISLFLTGSAAALFVSWGNPRERRAVVWAIFAGLCVIVAVFAWQRWYYGDWFPNTFYLKASGDTRQLGRGLKYVAKFALQDFQIAFLIGPLVYLVGGLWKHASRRVFLPAAVILGGWVCYVIWVGGDVFSLSRFWTPIISMMAACTVLLLCQWWAGRARMDNLPGSNWRLAAEALLAALLALQLVTGPLRVWSLVRSNKGGAEEGVAYAIALRTMPLPPGSIIGVFLAGTTPYFMPDTQFHDFLGKCDKHIAHSPAHWGPPGHNKWDFAYSLGAVRPRYIISDAEYPAPSAQTDAAMQDWVSARKDFGFHPALWLNPLFRRDYVRAAAFVDGAPVRGQSLFVRKHTPNGE